MMTIEPVTLEDEYVRLEPLSHEHYSALCEHGLNPDLWRVGLEPLYTPDDMHRFIGGALEAQQQGTALPFAIVDKVSGKVVGSTRYGHIDRQNRHLEIGWTWIGKPWQRTAINTHAKYLLLAHAFEILGCIRIEIITDVLNETSRNAILRLGAKQEGILRKHLIASNGRIRDSVCFSIIDEEWPAVKQRLETMIIQYIHQ